MEEIEMIQNNGKITPVIELEEMILQKWWQYLKQSRDWLDHSYLVALEDKGINKLQAFHVSLIESIPNQSKFVQMWYLY